MIKIGLDVVQIGRMERIFQKFGFKFCEKILRSEELRRLEVLKVGKAGFLAKRFALKEAISKAFGVGIGRALGFQDILILNDSRGAPYAQIDQEKLTSLLNGKTCQISISVADDYPVAIAFAMIAIS